MSPSDLSLGRSSSRCLLGLGMAHHQETGRRLQSFGHAALGVTCQVLFAIRLCPMVQVTRGAPPRNRVVGSCKVQELGSVRAEG